MALLALLENNSFKITMRQKSFKITMPPRAFSNFTYLFTCSPIVYISHETFYPWHYNFNFSLNAHSLLCSRLDDTKNELRKFWGGFLGHWTGHLKQTKGSASKLNKLVWKDSPHIQKPSGTNLFPRSRHRYIYQLSKNPCPKRASNHSLFVTTRCN